MPVTILDDTSSGWANFSGSGALAYDAVNVKETGTSALQITQSAPQSRERWTKPVSFTADPATIYGFWVELEGWLAASAGPALGGGVRIMFYQNGFTDSATYVATLDLTVGYSLPTFQLQDMVAKTGGWSDTGVVDNILIDIDVRVASAAQTVRINQIFGGLEDGAVNKARILWRTDDGLKNVLTAAKPVLDQYNYVAMNAVIANNIGAGPTTMDASELTQIFNAGWTMANHGEASTALTGFTPLSAAIAEVVNGRAAIAQWDNNARMFMYAQGEIGDATNYPNRELLDIMAPNGEAVAFQTAKYATDAHSEARGLLGDLGNIPSYFLDGKSVASVQARIDKAIRLKETLILSWHNLVDPPVVQTDYSLIDFETVAAYVNTKEQAGELDVLDPVVWGAEYNLWASPNPTPPTLTSNIPNQSTAIGASTTVDVKPHISGATSYVFSNLPTGAVDNGDGTATLTGASVDEYKLITVMATSGSGLTAEFGFTWWIGDGATSLSGAGGAGFIGWIQ